MVAQMPRGLPQADPSRFNQQLKVRVGLRPNTVRKLLQIARVVVAER